MSEKDTLEDTLVETGKVSCRTCLKEIPKSEAKVSEARDYVMYFCGLDCYQKWKKEEAENNDV